MCYLFLSAKLHTLSVIVPHYFFGLKMLLEAVCLQSRDPFLVTTFGIYLSLNSYLRNCNEYKVTVEIGSFNPGHMRTFRDQLSAACWQVTCEQSWNSNTFITWHNSTSVSFLSYVLHCFWRIIPFPRLGLLPESHVTKGPSLKRMHKPLVSII